MPWEDFLLNSVGQGTGEGAQPKEDRFQFNRESTGVFSHCEQFNLACLGGQQAAAIDVSLKKTSASLRKLRLHLA